MHLRILQQAIALPFNTPYFSTACAAYSEQVGVKRHIRGHIRREMG